MKIDDKILREVLQEKIAIIKNSRMHEKEVEKWMAEKYNVEYGTTVDIFNGISPIETLSYEMLYKLLKSIHGAIRDNWMDLSELIDTTYFTTSEIELFEMPLMINEKDEDIVFDEWLQVNFDQFSTKATIDEIIKWRNMNKLKYNPKTQRDLTVKNSRGVEIKVVSVNEKSLGEIYDLMIKDEFISDEITINIDPDRNEYPLIKNGKLIIQKESTIDLIDGFHRYWAMCLVKTKNPNRNYVCKINVVMFNEEKANRYMLQQDKKNHFSDNQTTRIQSNEANYVIKRLNGENSFHLKGSIDDDMLVYLSRLITLLFEPKSREDSFFLFDTIKKNMNELIEKKGYFSKVFSKSEWFIYLYFIKASAGSNLKLVTYAEKNEIDKLLEKIAFANMPLKKHYKLLDKIIKEVNTDAE